MLTCCVLTLGLLLARGVACAGAVEYVDGISDQHFGSWAGSYTEPGGFNGPFATYFANVWVGHPPSHIKLTRYVAQWDVMRGAGYPEELANLKAWYQHTTELGLTPELALANFGCSGCEAPEKSESITRELEALHSAFPAIAVYEAWNEPNLAASSFHVTAAAAAEYMNATYAYCASHGCTAIAGDFSDAEPNMTTYEREYEANLSPRDPGNWGIHLYHAVKYETDETLVSFEALLPTRDADQVWFTEVSAYHCELGETRASERQRQNAEFLVNRLIRVSKPAHAFYYQAAWPYDESPPCDSSTQDTALYAATSTGGPLQARPAAAVIFSEPGSSAAELQPSAGLEAAAPRALRDPEFGGQWLYWPEGDKALWYSSWSGAGG